MTTPKSILILTILLLLASENLAKGLKCYVCEKAFVKGAEMCEITEEEGPFRECEQDQLCGAHHEWPNLFGLEEGVPDRMIRDCFYPNYCDLAMNRSMETYKAGLGQCYTCNTDLCNSATSVIPSFTVITLFAVKYYFL